MKQIFLFVTLLVFYIGIGIVCVPFPWTMMEQDLLSFIVQYASQIQGLEIRNIAFNCNVIIHLRKKFLRNFLKDRGVGAGCAQWARAHQIFAEIRMKWVKCPPTFSYH